MKRENNPELIELRDIKEEKKDKSISRKIIYIILYCIVGIIFITTIVAIIGRFTGDSFTLFGNRFDVVLTDSMSSKNENHLDFLEGTRQIGVNDLVVSHKIDETTELQVKDIVLFNHPKVGTDMHRIVDMRDNGKDEVTVDFVKKVNIDGQDYFQLYDLGSNAITNYIEYDKVELEVYTSINFDDNFQFYLGESFTKNIKTDLVSTNWYKTNITLTKNSGEQTATKFSFGYGKYSDYKNFYLSNIRIYSVNGQINANASNLNLVDGKTLQFSNIFNQRYEYLIRGDKALTSDGWYTKDKLISKVTSIAPGIGLVFRFLQSLWGIICLLGLVILFIFYDLASYLIDKANRIYIVKVINGTSIAEQNEKLSSDIEFIEPQKVTNINKEEEDIFIDENRKILHEVVEESEDTRIIRNRANKGDLTVEELPNRNESYNLNDLDTSIKKKHSGYGDLTSRVNKRTRQNKNSKVKFTDDITPTKKKYLNKKSSKAN